MSEIDELVAALRRDGSLESKGKFSDQSKAREKMRQFQLADPRRYVLELLQGAVVRGAKRIRFDIDADTMTMRFDGDGFDSQDIEHLWGSVFATGKDAVLAGRRQLAIGINAASSLDPKSITI